MITLLIFALMAILVIIGLGLVSILGPIILIPIALIAIDIMFLKRLFRRKER